MIDKGKLTDREIQEILDLKVDDEDKELIIEGREDAEIYSKLFMHLNQPPAVVPSVNFAELTLLKAKRKKRLRDIYHKVGLYALVSIPLVAISFIAILIFSPTLINEFASQITSNLLLVGFSALVLFLIQYFDKTLIKNKMPNMRI